jgi:DNA repair protein RadC
MSEPEAPAKPHFHGHRARLRQRVLEGGIDAMPDYELLEIVLQAALPRRDTKPIAKALLAEFKSLAGVLAATPAELQAVAGVGEIAAVQIKATHAVVRHMLRGEAKARPAFSESQHVLDYCRADLAHARTEQFRLLFLDKKNQLIADETQQRGTVDRASVYPREVVKRALELGASALILVHNHPSGDPTPSRDDIDITRAVARAAATVEVAVHDHIIIGRDGHASLRALGLI